jgi:predicted nucleotidyltransferase
MDNKLKIISYLGKNKERTFTMHELSNILGIPYASFYRTIQVMPDMIVKTKKGQAYLLELKASNQISSSYLAIASEDEKKDLIKKQPIIGKICSGLDTQDTVLLFGSYAKGTQAENSDIDLLIINKTGKKTLSFSNYETLLKKKINPIFVTRAEFKKMLRDKKENVGKQALKDHVILNNPQKFWEMVL